MAKATDIQREQRDFRQEFTDQVITAIESGQKLPWEKPWRAVGAPRNAVSEKEYNGANRLILGVAMMQKGWDDPRFVTFKQAIDLGGAVNKGERGTQIEKWNRTEFWQRRDVQVLEDQHPVSVASVDHGEATLRDGRTVRTASLRAEHDGQSYTWAQAENDLTVLSNRAYTVFNVAQCRDLKIESIEQQRSEPVSPEQRVESILRAMQATGLQFQNGTEAYYMPSRDLVVTPKPEQFHTLGDYQSTLLHEIGHATGHESRLNRPTLTAGARFGTPEYAREELRAELFSAYIAMETGITRTRDEQHHAYLQSWAEALKKDKNEIFRAATDASKAVDYVLAQEKSLQISRETVSVEAQEANPASSTPASKLKVVEIDAPAAWASALVNRDESGLEPSEAVCVRDWIGKQGVGWPVSASETFMGRHEGLLTEMATYTFLVPERKIGLDGAVGHQPSGSTPAAPDRVLRPATVDELSPELNYGLRAYSHLLPKKHQEEITFVGLAEKIEADYASPQALATANEFRKTDGVLKCNADRTISLFLAQQPALGPGLTTVEHSALKPGHDLVDDQGRMSRVLDISKRDEGRTITTEKDLDSGLVFHKTYGPQPVTVTALSIAAVAREEKEREQLQAARRIEDDKQITGTLQSRGPIIDGREVLHVRRMGEDVSVSVPAGAVSREHEPGTPLKLRYDSAKKELTVEPVGKQRAHAVER